MDGPVLADIGPITVRLAHPRPGTGFEDGLPWAWLAVCPVTFRFGGRVTSKRLRAKHQFTGPDRPADYQIALGRASALMSIRNELALHGLRPPKDRVPVVEEPELLPDGGGLLTGGIRIF